MYMHIHTQIHIYCIFIYLMFLHRNDLTKPISFFMEMKRVLHLNWHKDPGCKAKPLFHIPLERVIVDELHMFLRVTDILEKGVILEVINWDEVKF